MMMRARHLFFAPEGEKGREPREISCGGGNIMQMKDCRNMILPCLAKLSLFANLTEAECETLCGELDMRLRKYAAGELVAHECDPVAEVYVIVSGRVSVRECGLREDSRHLVCRLGPGDVYGAMLPALELKTNPGMVTADRSSEILLCKVDRIRRLLAAGTHPAFVANLYRAAARQGFYAWRKLMLLSCYEISDRLRLYLRWRKEEGLSERDLPPVSELAEYLGVNRTALHRVLRKVLA